MKKQRTIRTKVGRDILFLFVIYLVFCFSSAFGYSKNTHYKITLRAVEKSLLDEAVKQIGFMDGAKQEIEGSFETESIEDWIKYGSNWEDTVGVRFNLLGSFNEDGIYYCHYYNPITDSGFTDSDGNIKGQSLIERANNDQDESQMINDKNEWSYQMVKKLYYAALTGDSSKYYSWRMRDHGSMTTFSGKENMNKIERDQFFAWTFQALGHILHLVQDASVPAHTRNDAHMHIPYTGGILQDTEPYEDWTEIQAESGGDEFNAILNGNGSDPWTYWKESDIKVPDVFIDTGYLENGQTTPRAGLNQGIAEYSHSNFLSKDTIFNNDYPETINTLHDLDSVGMAQYGDVIFKDYRHFDNGKVHSFFYVKNDTAQIDHFALCGIAWHIKQMEFWGSQHVNTVGISYSVDDPLVNKDYATKLIPRAVGYSAGLLDYFFRGKLHVKRIMPSTEEEIDDPFHQYDTGNDIDKIAVHLQNNSRIGEDIKPIGAGILTLSISYTDASDTVVYRSGGSVNVSGIPALGGGSYFAALFTLEEPIEVENIKDRKYYSRDSKDGIY